MLLPSDRPQGCRGEDGPAFQGNFRKGEASRELSTLTKTTASAAAHAASSARFDAISGGLGAIHKIRDDACVSCGQCLSACPFGAIEQMSFVDDVVAALKDPKKFVVADIPLLQSVLHWLKNSAAEPGDLC